MMASLYIRKFFASLRVFQRWLQWTTQVTQMFGGRHAYVWAIPTRVHDYAGPLELLELIPTASLQHVQFRRLSTSYAGISNVIQQTAHLKTLTRYELGGFDELQLEMIIDLPVATNLRTLRIRHLPTRFDKDRGILLSKILLKLTSLMNLILKPPL